MPAGLHVASDAPTLCPELRFWVGPYLSLNLWPPDQSSRPWGGPQPPPRLIQIFLPGGRVRAWGRCAVLQVRLCGPALLSDYFCKNCIICGCYPSPSASGPICLPGPSAHPSAALRSLRLLPALAVRASPAEAQDPTACPKNSFLGGKDGVMLSRRFEPRDQGRWTLHETPLPYHHQAKAQSSLTGLPLFRCQIAPARVSQPLSGAKTPFPKPCSVCVSVLCVPLCSNSPRRAASNPL